MRIKYKVAWVILICIIISIFVLKIQDNKTDNNANNGNIDSITVVDSVSIQDSILFYSNIVEKYENSLDSIFDIQDNKDTLTIKELKYYDSIYAIYEKDITNTYNKIDSLVKIIK